MIMRIKPFFHKGSLFLCGLNLNLEKLELYNCLTILDNSGLMNSLEDNSITWEYPIKALPVNLETWNMSRLEGA